MVIASTSLQELQYEIIEKIWYVFCWLMWVFSIFELIIIWKWFHRNEEMEFSPSTCSILCHNNSPNPLLPIIADSSWKKDCFKGNFTLSQTLIYTFLRVQKIWYQLKTKIFLRFSPSSATRKPKNGMISVWLRCWASFQISKISTKKINDDTLRLVPSLLLFPLWVFIKYTFVCMSYLNVKIVFIIYKVWRMINNNQQVPKNKKRTKHKNKKQ